MKGLRKSADRARHGKAFPATMTPTKSLWNLSGGAGAGAVAVCGVIVVAVCGVIVVAVYGVTGSPLRVERLVQPAVVRFLMLIGHECRVTGQRTFVAVGKAACSQGRNA